MNGIYKLDENEDVCDVLPKMSSTDEAIASHFSGTEFPTENLSVGMECYRTDENKIYMLKALPDDWHVIWDLSLTPGHAKTADEATKAASDGSGNPIADTYLKKADTIQLKRNTAYAVGDIATSPLLPSWAYLECTTAGTTGDTEPDFSEIKSGGGGS